jgi:hypothetical protein
VSVPLLRMDTAVRTGAAGPSLRTAPTPRPRKGSVVVPSRCPDPNWTGANCKRRGCPHCGRGWVYSWEQNTRLNVGGNYGDVVLISLTAPGKDRLPWSCPYSHAHSGSKYGCQVEAAAATAWAKAAPDNWRRLRDAARKAVGRAGFPIAHLVLERVWEPQKRGVPHLHVVAGARSELERQAAELFYDELLRRAPEYGFGSQVHVTKVMRAHEAARYLAGYLLGRSKHKGTIRDNLADKRMPFSLIWITPVLASLSSSERMAAMRERLGVERGTGVTMRRLRYARWYLAALRGKCHVYPELYGEEMLAVAGVVVLLERGNAPPEQRFRAHVRTLRENRRPQAPPLGSDLGASSLAARGLMVAA